MDNTAMTAGSEAFQTALVFYNSVKMATRRDVPGATAVCVNVISGKNTTFVVGKLGKC
jgi:hypothetical protein